MQLGLWRSRLDTERKNILLATMIQTRNYFCYSYSFLPILTWTPLTWVYLSQFQSVGHSEKKTRTCREHTGQAHVPDQIACTLQTEHCFRRTVQNSPACARAERTKGDISTITTWIHTTTIDAPKLTQLPDDERPSVHDLDFQRTHYIPDHKQCRSQLQWPLFPSQNQLCEERN